MPRCRRSHEQVGMAEELVQGPEPNDGRERAGRRAAGSSRSYPKNHYLGRFDQGGDGLALLQAHLANRVRRDDGRDTLTSDRECYLGHQALSFDIRDPADQLIPSADFAEIVAALAHVAGFGCAIEKLVDLLLWNAMVAAGGLDGSNFAFVDPLFESRIADTQHLGCFARRK